MDDKLQTLVAMFPDIPEDVARAALERTGGSLENAVDVLLAGGEDALDPAAAAGVSQAELDESLARTLQAELDLENDPGPPLRGRDPAPVAFDPTLFAHLDVSVVNTLLAQSKDNLVPLLLSELQNVQLPPIDERIEDGALAPVAFGFSNVSVSQLAVDPANVTLRFERGAILLEAVDVSASIEKVDWYYRKESFPQLKDDGQADASISNTKIMATMALQMNDFGPWLRTQSCEVTIGKLDLKLSGTAASVIYNLVLKAAKSSITASVERTLSQMLFELLGRHSEDLVSIFQ